MDSSEDYDMGYTPARGTVESISGLIHRPWDRPQDGKTTAVKTRTERRIKDPLLQKLAELMDGCSNAQPGGCESCPKQRCCYRWWNGITNDASKGQLVMTQEMFRKYRGEFEDKIRPK